MVVLFWFDGQRERCVVGYVGEDNISADTWYRVGRNGKLEVAPDSDYTPFKADQLDAEKMVAATAAKAREKAEAAA